MTAKPALATVAAAWLWMSAGTEAQTCSPSGAPIARTSNDHYFTYDGAVTPLVGLSYEYLCHVSLYAPFSSQYCSLSNYAQTLQTLHSDGDNLIRLTTIFNSSPGLFQNFSTPFPHEEPYLWTGSKWDLSQFDPDFLPNLESVVCSAYNLGMIVEITLLDPWNPKWTQSPFNPSNTAAAGQGFTASQYFATFDDPTANPPQDGNPQNATTRQYQEAGVAAIVNRLKRYPNVIWEIANEPDFGPSSVPLAYVVQWEEAMLHVVQQNDSDPPHEIIVNGHTASSFAWNVAGAAVQAAHYTQIHQGGFEGAIQIMRDASLAGDRGAIALGFDEGQSVPNNSYTWRTADDLRAEAYEFLFDGGGLFNGYSYNMLASSATTAAMQVGALRLLLSQDSANLNAMQQTSCGAGEWCQGIVAWGLPDPGFRCTTSPTANLYWSTMSTNEDFWLYLHHGQPMSAVVGGPPVYDGITSCRAAVDLPPATRPRCKSCCP